MLSSFQDTAKSLDPIQFISNRVKALGKLIQFYLSLIFFSEYLNDGKFEGYTFF